MKEAKSETFSYSQTQMQWHADLVTTDMLWCDLIISNPFSHGVSENSQYAQEYIGKLKNKMTQAFNGQCIYLLCKRKKVRFDLSYKPKYNFLTKKTRFYVLLGSEHQRVSISVDLAAYFLLDKSNPTLFLESKFITLLKDRRDRITLSIHDFLSSINFHLGIETEVLAAECTCSPYNDPAFTLNDFQHEMAANSHQSCDLFLYVNTYNIDLNIKTLISYPSKGDVYDLDKPADSLFLMLSRSLSFYFFGEEKTDILAVKNASDNLGRFVLRNQNFKIKISQVYEGDNEYTLLKSQKVSSSVNHQFTILSQDNELIIFHDDIHF